VGDKATQKNILHICSIITLTAVLSYNVHGRLHKHNFHFLF